MKGSVKPSQPPSPEQLERTGESLSAILRTLAFVSYQATEDSGDYRHPGNGGRRGIYKTYWENEYRFVFFAAFYTLDDDLRRDPSIRKLAQEAAKIYGKVLADKEACAVAYRERQARSKRIGALRLFDGKRVRKLAAITWSEIVARMNDDGFLVGWDAGLPPHLAHLRDRPVVPG